MLRMSSEDGHGSTLLSRRHCRNRAAAPSSASIRLQNVVPTVLGSFRPDVMAALPKRGHIARHGRDRNAELLRDSRGGVCPFTDHAEHELQSSFDVEGTLIQHLRGLPTSTCLSEDDRHVNQQMPMGPWVGRHGLRLTSLPLQGFAPIEPAGRDATRAGATGSRSRSGLHPDRPSPLIRMRALVRHGLAHPAEPHEVALRTAMLAVSLRRGTLVEFAVPDAERSRRNRLLGRG